MLGHETEVACFEGAVVPHVAILPTERADYQDVRIAIDSITASGNVGVCREGLLSSKRQRALNEVKPVWGKSP